MPHSWTQHLHALLLAMASSTDNFAVGFSVGIKRQPLPLSVNVIIAVCNAAGALLAATVGGTLTGILSFAPILASFAFAFLGLQQVCNTTNANTPPLTLSLALPMTLNNLAGGVAGGVVGIQPNVAFLYALVASLVAMAMGHWVACALFARSESFRGASSSRDSVVAAIIYFALSLVTLYEAIR